MSRLFSSGFELNSAITNGEFTAANGTPNIQATTVRSGGFAMRHFNAVSGVAKFLRQLISASQTDGPLIARIYLRWNALPSADNQIFQLSAGNTRRCGISITSTGTLILNDEDGAIGSPSAALSQDTWYRVELYYDRTAAAGSHVISARIDGVDFASSSTRSLSGGVDSVRVGGNLLAEAQTDGIWFIDDIAVNDTNGSFQNSYPGDEKLIRVNPDATGDVNTFATQTGGTAGAANNFTRVDEVQPDDASTLNGSNTLNQEDLFNVQASGLSPTDIINVVHVGIRYRNNVADAATEIKAEIEKTTGGTIVQSPGIIPNLTAFRTNATAITRYQDPDNSDWTPTTLDSMQIGYKLTTGGTNRVEVTTIWAYIGYRAGAAEASTPTRAMMGIGT